MIHKFLLYTWTIRKIAPEQYRFNIYNPIAWFLLFILAISVSVAAGFKSFGGTIAGVVRDALAPAEVEKTA